MNAILAFAPFALSVLLIVVLNKLDQRRRAKMTPEERKREDEEIRREMQIW